MTNLTKASMEKLTEMLALPATGHEQDWDIELADANRIVDFLEAFDEPRLSTLDRFALMRLLLASVDRFIETESRVPEEWPRIAAMLTAERELHDDTLRYWSCEGEDDPDSWFH